MNRDEWRWSQSSVMRSTVRKTIPHTTHLRIADFKSPAQHVMDLIDLPIPIDATLPVAFCKKYSYI